MQIPHVQGGERFRPSAAAFNGMIDAANDYARRNLSQIGAGPLPPLAPGQVYVKNTTGATRKRYDVLVASALSTATLAKSSRTTTSENMRYAPVVLGITPVPATDVHHGRAVVLDAPAIADAIVPAWVSGVCVARLEYTASAGEAAEIDTDHRFKNAHSGPVRIIALGEATAERLALVELGGFGTWRTVVEEIEATATELRVKTREVRHVGEKALSDWVTLLDWAPCDEE
jgi:hypothetical protein